MCKIIERKKKHHRTAPKFLNVKRNCGYNKRHVQIKIISSIYFYWKSFSYKFLIYRHKKSIILKFSNRKTSILTCKLRFVYNFTIYWSVPKSNNNHNNNKKKKNYLNIRQSTSVKTNKCEEKKWTVVKTYAFVVGHRIQNIFVSIQPNNRIVFSFVLLLGVLSFFHLRTFYVYVSFWILCFLNRLETFPHKMVKLLYEQL